LALLLVLVYLWTSVGEPLMSIFSAFPELVKAVLEGVNRRCIDYILRKTVPRSDHTLTEIVLSDIQTRSVGNTHLRL